MINQSRRTLLKGIGYGMTTVVAGLGSSAAMAALSPTDSIAPSSAFLNETLSIYQQQSDGKEIVSLMNLTGKSITVDRTAPVGLEQMNGSLVVKVNQDANGAISINAGERLSFEVEAVSANLLHEQSAVAGLLTDHVKIQSEHPAFNGLLPITSLAA